jgi:KipI family sensor histidine kinase inhibitor
VGDSAILIELGSEIDADISSSVYGLAGAVTAAAIPGVIEMIPTYRSLLVSYDPLVARYREMEEQLGAIVSDAESCDDDIPEPEIIEIPVVYGGEEGPDIKTVADHAWLSVHDVIKLHSGIDYRVYMIGFAPGFPYLGGLDRRIATPRLKTPRVSVPAGSVGIAESQTGVYPNASPGGWQIIGRTNMRLFNVESSSPSLITPGSLVRFVPVDSHE